jgi:hypothetical protein
VLDIVTLFGYTLQQSENPIRPHVSVGRPLFIKPEAAGAAHADPAFFMSGAIMPKKPFVAARPAALRFNARSRATFLEHLAETSNVTASAREAGVTTSTAYRERVKTPSFAADWHRALCEGYARLETMLLADALIAPSGNVSERTLKARAQKHKLQLALMAAHAASVRGDMAGPRRAAKSGTAQSRVKAKIDQMNKRLTGDPQS